MFNTAAGFAPRVCPPPSSARFMHSKTALIALMLCVACPIIAAANENAGSQTAKSSDRGWTQLFDGKSFAGWYVQIQNQKRNEDPAKYFQVDHGVIHVYKDQPAGTAVPNGYLATDKMYSHFQLRMEYKWGEKKFK